MEKEMNEEILKIVEKNMPKQAGELLQKRLAKADEMEETIKRLDGKLSASTEKIDELEALSTGLEAENEQLRKRDADVMEIHEDNKKLLADLIRREDALDLTLIKKELELIKESRTEIKELTNTVFRNRTVRETIHKSSIEHSMNNPQYSDNGTFIGDKITPTGGTEDLDKTTTEE